MTRAKNEVALVYPMLARDRYGVDVILEPSRFVAELPDDVFERWTVELEPSSEEVEEAAGRAGELTSRRTSGPCRHSVLASLAPRSGPIARSADEAMKDDIYSAICREALESRQRDVMSFVDNGMAGMSTRLEKTLLRLPAGHFLLGLGPYNAGLVKLDFDELLIGREVPEFIGVGMPVSGFRVSSPDAFLNAEVSRLHAKVVRRMRRTAPHYRLVDMRSTCGTYLNGDPIPAPDDLGGVVRGRLRAAADLGRLLLARPVGRQSLPLLPEVIAAGADPAREPGRSPSSVSASPSSSAVDLARGSGRRCFSDPDAVLGCWRGSCSG